jgi:hypothetical protein
MRIRNFLIIHSSRSIRAMIKKCILADLGDVQITECDLGKDGLLLLINNLFDLVIANSDLADMRLADFRIELEESAAINKNVNFIILCENQSETDHLAKEGFQHIVSMPFDRDAFNIKINQVCNPRKWRQNERFHIPNSKAILNVWGMNAEAKIINISLGGVMIEISGDRSELLLQNNPRLTLKIKHPNGFYSIEDLPVKLSRLNVVGWNANHKPTTMRVAFVFLNLDQASAVELEHIFQIDKM